MFWVPCTHVCMFLPEKSEVTLFWPKACMHTSFYRMKGCVKLFQHKTISCFFRYGCFFTFFYIYKKKILDSGKFSTSGFWWFYMFWNVLNTIWLFRENVCLSVCVCDKNFMASVARELIHRISWNFVFRVTLS